LTEKKRYKDIGNNKKKMRTDISLSPLLEVLVCYERYEAQLIVQQGEKDLGYLDEAYVPSN